jgi:type IV fimbrial biogenesis protein FimT
MAQLVNSLQISTARLNKSQHAADGFTLVELMVTVAVFAILASIAIPSFQTTIQRNRLSTTANELLAAVQASRSEALRLNQTVRFCTTPADWQMTRQSDGTVLKQGSIASQATVGAFCADFRGDGMSYNTDGSPMTNGNLPVTVGSYSKAVVIRVGSANVQ